VLQALFSGLVRAGSRSFQRSSSSAAVLMPPLSAGTEDASHAAAPASPAAHGVLPAVDDSTIDLTARSAVIRRHQSLAYETAELTGGAAAQPADADGERRQTF